MKTGVHPEYHSAVDVTCVCGNTMTVGSTKADIQTEVCSHCHPFYTGQKKILDTAGRVERFARILEKTKEKRSATSTKKTTTTKKTTKRASAKKLG